jgi:hypothetical protein
MSERRGRWRDEKREGVVVLASSVARGAVATSGADAPPCGARAAERRGASARVLARGRVQEDSMTRAIEIGEAVEGSPHVIGTANRLRVEAAIVRACDCALELRLETGGLVECAKCGAPVHAREAAA